MSRIPSKDTKIELDLRSALHRRGFRFGRNLDRLPCKPDIVLPRWKAVILVHGCFWHRHEGCRFATTPKSNTEKWLAKFQANITRDRRNIADLQEAGWRVMVVWECEIKPDGGATVTEQISDWLKCATKVADSR